MNTQFSIPDAGCQIAITFEFPSYVIGSSKVNKTTITGVVEKATRFTPPNFVRIVTDFDSPVRIREIPLHRITDIKHADGTTAIKEVAKVDIRSWVVEGSRDSKYTVVRSKNIWTCTCPGYQFRKSCKHVTELKNA
jgi:hypothetical protein